MRKYALERDLQKAVVAYLEDREATVGDITFLHIPNEGKRTALQGYRAKRQGLRPGAPDLIVWASFYDEDEIEHPITYQIELKSMTGRQSTAQEAFEVRLLNVGHTYDLVTGVKTEAEAVEAVEAIIDG
jgi:hypothetical protein